MVCQVPRRREGVENRPLPNQVFRCGTCKVSKNLRSCAHTHTYSLACLLSLTDRNQLNCRQAATHHTHLRLLCHRRSISSSLNIKGIKGHHHHHCCWTKSSQARKVFSLSPLLVTRPYRTIHHEYKELSLLILRLYTHTHTHIAVVVGRPKG